MARPTNTAPTRPAPRTGGAAGTKTAPRTSAGNTGTAAAKPAGLPGPGSKAMTKLELYARLAANTGLTKLQIAAVFEELGTVIAQQVGKKGPGLFILSHLVKFRVIRKPATKAKQGVNPFTKEPMTFKAKPARNVVKALPLKILKEAV